MRQNFHRPPPAARRFFQVLFAPIVIPRVKGCWGRRGGQENFEFFMGFWSKIGRGPGHVAEFDDLTDLTEFDGGPAQIRQEFDGI